MNSHSSFLEEMRGPRAKAALRQCQALKLTTGEAAMNTAIKSCLFRSLDSAKGDRKQLHTNL